MRKQVSRAVLTELATAMKFGLVEVCLNKTCSKILLGKYFSATFALYNGLKYEDALSPLLFNFARH